LIKGGVEGHQILIFFLVSHGTIKSTEAYAQLDQAKLFPTHESLSY
jgi:hypothetical protein